MVLKFFPVNPIKKNNNLLDKTYLMNVVNTLDSGLILKTILAL